MLRTAVEPLDIEAFLSESISATATSALIVSFAEQQLGEALAENSEALGHASTYVQTVDGVKDAPLSRVRPDGTIVFDFNLISDLFAWILRLLRSFSPVLSGRYAASHEFYADGVLADPENPPAASVYRFVSSLPYAGKIEGEDDAPESKQAPNGVYQVVAAMAAAQRPDANVAFAFQDGRPTITITVG